ncbi:MAG TPA: hypothetical protein VMV23_00340 [Candidatus Nanopelagicaceae bacterium]|nr:hypothetical protein [Candidatus Nanopelagicaceae bacterium]
MPSLPPLPIHEVKHWYFPALHRLRWHAEYHGRGGGRAGAIDGVWLELGAESGESIDCGLRSQNFNFSWGPAEVHESILTLESIKEWLDEQRNRVVDEPAPELEVERLRAALRDQDRREFHWHYQADKYRDLASKFQRRAVDAEQRIRELEQKVEGLQWSMRRIHG